jgi:flagellar hook-length control protein FliK
MNMQEKFGQSQGLSSLNMDEDSFARNLNASTQDRMPGPRTDPANSPNSVPIENEVSPQSPETALAALVAAARATQGRVNGAEEEAFDEEAGSPPVAVDVPRESLQAKPQLKGENLNLDSGAASSQGQQQGFESFKQQQDGFSDQSNLKSANGELLAKSKLNTKGEFKNVLSAEGALQAQALPLLKQDFTATATAGATAAAGFVAPTPGENEANVRQIMNQAQYLIKQGGGEMKVQMSPEGMGPIHMKVMVENGKVNVQMVAETDEAKKTLESGLSYLKNSLAAHRLSMDHVKIDVVNSTNAENNTQNQMNQDSSGREQTRQFWNRFSENFGSSSQQRDGLADIPSMKGYPRKRTDSPLEPISSASVKQYAGAGKGKGLNLVA